MFVISLEAFVPLRNTDLIGEFRNNAIWEIEITPLKRKSPQSISHE